MLKPLEDTSFLDTTYNSFEPIHSVNIFRLCGFPRRELVSSRIWAYFFDPAERHGLGTLFVDALLSLLQEHLGKKREDDLSASGTWFDDDWTVETEVTTKDSQRIDLLVASDSRHLTIAIENKVDAALYNDLPAYAGHACEISGIDGRSYCVVLSSYTISDEVVGADIYLTYNELFARVLRGLPSTLGTADARSIDILMQFVENYGEDSSGMNANHDQEVSKVLESLEGKDESIREFLQSLTSLSQELKERGYRLRGRIEQIFTDGDLTIDDKLGPITVKEAWPTLERCAKWQIEKTWQWDGGTKISGLRSGCTCTYVGLGLSDNLDKGPAAELILGLSPVDSGDKHGSGIRIKAYRTGADNYNERFILDHESLGVTYADSDEVVLKAFLDRAEEFAKTQVLGV